MGQILRLYPHAFEMSFDAFQQVFALSLASNAIRALNGNQESLQKTLDCFVSEVLQLLGADWKRVWGSTVLKEDPADTKTGPENAWYVAYHPRFQFEDGSVHPTYVIAVAGTPEEAQNVWRDQNLAITTVSDYNAWVATGIQNPPVPSIGIQPGVPYIATGAVRGTYLLLNTPGPKDPITEGKTLLEFIKGVDQSSSPRFITTGHSLGGALSPSLALSLVRAGLIPADRTLTYPTAGASPGDTNFTKLFTEILPRRKAATAKSYQGWNFNLVNDLDIVPQAWALAESVSPGQNLMRIPTIYGKKVLWPVAVGTGAAVLASKKSGVLYYPIPSQHFTRPPAPPTPGSMKEFLKTASHQHTQVYLDELGIVLPPLHKCEVLVGGVSEKTEAEQLYGYPVIGDYQWGEDHPTEAREVLNKVKASKEAEPYLAGIQKELASED